MIFEVMDNENSNFRSQKGFVSYTLETNRSNAPRKRMPAISSSLSKKRLTVEEIEEKMRQAEKRRIERNQRRSKHAAENREKMLDLATKINKLVLHKEASNSKANNSDDSNFIMDKKEYCKTAAEVSFAFENISERYENYLAVTKPQGITK